MQGSCDMPDDTEVPEEVKNKVGRTSTFSIEIGEMICEDIENCSKGLKTICEGNDKYPSARTFHRWLNESDDLRHRYARAKENQADFLIDEVIQIADNDSEDIKIVGEDEREVQNSEFIQRSKVRIETRFRLAGKLHAKKWGDRQEIDFNSDAQPIIFNVSRASDKNKD